MKVLQAKLTSIDELKDHPRNYRQHPEDQMQHLCASIQAHGVYRNIVTASDLTILAGHGVVKACRILGIKQVPVIRLPLDPLSIKALKVMAADNEVGHLGEVDDRALSELLKEVLDADDLLGTGYDEQMLANLLMVTRPASEIADLNEAAEWLGMPDYDEGTKPLKLVVSFRNESDRALFVEQTKLRIDKKETVTWMTRWPWKEREDLASLRFE